MNINKVYILNKAQIPNCVGFFSPIQKTPLASQLLNRGQ